MLASKLEKIFKKGSTNTLYNAQCVINKAVNLKTLYELEESYGSFPVRSSSVQCSTAFRILICQGSEFMIFEVVGRVFAL